jgi:hypothetical protein
MFKPALRFLLMVSCVFVMLGSVSVFAQYGPDTCRQGFVWRDAFPDDHVCVTPETRAQAAYDNSQASARREPGGGPYGPNTCRQGYVWREARPDDYVCVTPETRTQAASDNSQAAARRVGATVDSATRARCQRYADRAVQEYHIMKDHRRCGLRDDARWQPNYRNHYDWCVASPSSWPRSEEKLRDDHLYSCGGQIRFD